MSIILIPPPATSVRGQFKIANYNGVPGDVNYHDVLNMPANSGKIVFIKCEMTATNGNLRVTLDDVISNEVMITAGAMKSIAISLIGITLSFSEDAAVVLINLEYKNSVLIEVKQTNGANAISCAVLYQDG